MRHILVFLVLQAALLPATAAANEIECFGTDSRWCGTTASELHPEISWSVSHRARLPGLIIEVIVNSVSGVAGLHLALEPVSRRDAPEVLISLREPRQTYAEWHNFKVPPMSFDQGTAQASMQRSALEALMMASADCHLYVFVELSSPAGNHKISHKIGVGGLSAALRFARLGK